MSITKLTKALREHKVVFGTKKTIQNLKLGKAKVVFLAKNCPSETKDKIKSYEKIEVIELDEDSNEVALLCKRPHNISVLSY